MKTPTTALVILALTTGLATAQIPNVINYQGRLVDGETLVNGDVSLELRLYDSATNGTLLYADSNTVTVVDGLYSTHIGDDTIAGSLTNALTNAMVYLEVVVDGAALTPRERLVAVPYSLRATSAARSDRLAGGALTAVGERMYITDTIFLERMADGTIGVRDPWGRAWTHPSGLADNISPDGQSAYSPQVATDDNGNAIIVWEQYDTATNSQIFKSEYRSGIWTHPADRTDNISPDGQSAWSPQVAMDDSGNAIIVWDQYDGSKRQIFKSEYRSGSWTHPTDLTDNISPDGQSAYPSQVAMDNNGDAIIVWKQSDELNFQIFKSEYRSGIWTHPLGLADNISPDGQSAYLPQVAMDDNGNAIIVWEQYDGYSQIFKSEYRSGIWTHPTNLTDNISPDGQSAELPQVAMDDSGNGIIVWEQRDGSDDQIFKSEYRSGTWTHPTNFTDNISPDGWDAEVPQVAMDDNGSAVIVWKQYDGSRDQIFKSEYRSGTWMHPLGLADNISPDGRDADLPQVATDNNGNAIVVWKQYDDSWYYQIFKSEYRFGSWRHPGGLTDNISLDGRNADTPQVVIDNNGNAIIIWEQSDGSYYQIFVSERR